MQFWLTLIAVLVSDQISKWWVVTNFLLGESRNIIDGVLFLTYVQNRGAAFGIMQGQSWFFLLCAMLVIIGMIIFYIKYPVERFISLSMALIVGGAIGNLIDRWRYGFVVDFFDLGWWPVFNIADIGIVCGSICLLVFLFLKEEKEGKDG